jgi:hypothetical protein
MHYFPRKFNLFRNESVLVHVLSQIPVDRRQVTGLVHNTRGDGERGPPAPRRQTRRLLSWCQCQTTLKRKPPHHPTTQNIKSPQTVLVSWDLQPHTIKSFYAIPIKFNCICACVVFNSFLDFEFRTLSKRKRFFKEAFRIRSYIESGVM